MAPHDVKTKMTNRTSRASKSRTNATGKPEPRIGALEETHRRVWAKEGSAASTIIYVILPVVAGSALTALATVLLPITALHVIRSSFGCGWISALAALCMMLAALFVAYRQWCDMTRKAAWVEMQQLEHERTPENEKEDKAGQSAPRRRFTFQGPSYPTWMGDHFSVTHIPGYMVMIVVLGLWRLPCEGLRCLWRWALTGRFAAVATPGAVPDEAIFNYVTQTSVIILTEVSRDGRELILDIPDDLPQGQGLEITPPGLHLVMDVETKAVLRVTHRGRPLVGAQRNATVFGLVAQVMVFYVHPRMHASSEISAREIAKKGLDTLEPSSRHVVRLHDALIYSEIGALGKGRLSVAVNREIALENFLCERIVTHRFDERKRAFSRTYRFYMDGHKAMHALVRKHGLAVNAVHLFNNSVMHSIDHHHADIVIDSVGDAFCFDGSSHPRSIMRSRVNRWIWIPRGWLGWGEPERLYEVARTGNPFYADLYAALCKIDEDLANFVETSTSH